MPNEKRCPKTGALLFWPSKEDKEREELFKRMNKLENNISNINKRLEKLLEVIINKGD